ncbi:MAG: LysE family transporter [Bacteroidetes bacterium]|jgi:threonine/homoserine/homoserine lactone efflux protein|nr:LysE family transporter [Bacteroidota bacterium]
MIAPIVKGLLLGFILSISIGPVIFAILKQSLTNGRKAGYIFVAGVSLSDISLLFICNIFTAVFSLALTHKSVIALVGASFLLATGIYTLFFKKIVFQEGEEDKEKLMRKRDLLAIFASGFFMNTLNPSVFLFWFAWTAAIGTTATETSNPITYKLLVFGTCLLFVLLSDLLKVALAGKLRPKLTQHNMVVINRIAGVIILVFSAVLFYGSFSY